MSKILVSAGGPSRSISTSSTAQPTVLRTRIGCDEDNAEQLRTAGHAERQNSAFGGPLDLLTPKDFSEANSPLPRLHKLESVAERVGLSRSAIYREISAGRLKIVKIGRAVRVTEAEIVRYINSLPVVNA